MGDVKEPAPRGGRRRAEVPVDSGTPAEGRRRAVEPAADPDPVTRRRGVFGRLKPGRSSTTVTFD